LSDLNTQLASGLAQAQMDNLRIQAGLADNAQNRAIQALGAETALGDSEANRLMQRLQGLTQIQGIEQLENTLEFQEFQRQQQESNNAIAQALQYLGTSTNQLVQENTKWGDLINNVNQILDIDSKVISNTGNVMGMFAGGAG